MKAISKENKKDRKKQKKKVEKVKKRKLSTKFIILLLSISILPILISSTIIAWQASSALETETKNKLETIRDLKKDQVEDYFEQKYKELSNMSFSADVREGFAELDNGYDNGIASMEYLTAMNELDMYFTEYLNTFDFNDLFLIDKEGNVFYSVQREDDYDTNIIEGPFKDSNLAVAFNTSKDSQIMSISDYAFYEPTNGPTAFLSAPIYDTSQGFLGVIALQISDDSINKLMADRSGLGETGETYIVAEDRTMRSDSHFSKEKTLGIKEVQTEAVNKAFADKTNVEILEDYKGARVYSAYAPLEIEGLNWSIITEIGFEEVQDPIRTLLVNTFIIIGLLVVVITIVSVAASRKLTQPILKLSKMSKQVAKGDLTQKVNIQSNDEIGELGTSFNQMIDEIKRLVSHSKLISEEVTQTATSLEAMSNQNSQSIEQVSTSIDEIASGASDQAKDSADAVEHGYSLEKSVSDVKAYSESMKVKSSEMLSSNQKGMDILTDLVSKQQVSEQSIDAIKESIEALSKRISEIYNFTNVITDIAEQTNLLSLNASIEAARVGEHGKGFAVVAQEVRKLSDESHKASNKVKQVISMITEETNKTINVSKNASINFEHQGNAVKETEKVFNELESLTSYTIDQIDRIHEQVSTLDEVKTIVMNSLNNIGAVTEETSASVEEVSASMEEQHASTEEMSAYMQNLSKKAKELKESLTSFKL
ncbi:chemotaxis protein [Paraliobacillus quinghaiensis]|uniref:Chemotaxis protein n=1 Tax=Paraliobacillus quinghaiensis TaxID=470815 RepID=A0A917TUG1_9BACI|nr:methyl-accepting chemotaxis protein [Paraliobacillus quinghaiensis]GGM38798.1 chemotaxis protein [Paraliobacillus quinghaiensis]